MTEIGEVSVRRRRCRQEIQRLVTEFERQDHALGVRRIDLQLKLDNRKVAFCPY